MAVAIPLPPHFSQFLLGAKNCAKCSWRPYPDERCATSGLAVLATHRTDHLRPTQLSHFLLEARKSANCSRHPDSYDKPANQLAFPRDYRSCHDSCLKPRIPPTAACPVEPMTILQSSGHPPREPRTCHVVCGERRAHIAPCPASFVRQQSFRQPSPRIAQSPPRYVLVTVPAYRFAAGTAPSTPFAPSGTRRNVSPTGTTAPLAAPFTTYLRSRVHQMPPRSCPGLMNPRRAQSTALAVMEYHHCKPR